MPRLHIINHKALQGCRWCLLGGAAVSWLHPDRAHHLLPQMNLSRLACVSSGTSARMFADMMGTPTVLHAESDTTMPIAACAV